MYILQKKNINSSMTVFAEANVDVDLRMLRSFRVLRPLKLVSRIPSKQLVKINMLLYYILSIMSLDDYTESLSYQQFFNQLYSVPH